MDVLDEILSSLRLTGGVVIDGEFSGDFCVLAQFTPHHFAPFFPVPETLISYHYVRSGEMLIDVEGLPPTKIDAGTIAILPRNDPHTLASRIGIPPAVCPGRSEAQSRSSRNSEVFPANRDAVKPLRRH
jgi:hypothetical protein